MKNQIDIVKLCLNRKSKRFIARYVTFKIVEDTADKLVVDFNLGHSTNQLIDSLRIQCSHEHNHEDPSNVITTEDGYEFKSWTHDNIISISLSK